jgi:hypothetical protein
MTFLGSFARRLQRLVLTVSMGALAAQAGCGGSENTETPGGAPPITILPALNAFPPTLIKESSAPVVFTIRNNSSATLTRLSWGITGAPDDFKVGTSTCGSTLGREASCTLSVSFTPQTVGDKVGALDVSVNAVSAKPPIALTGTGTRGAALSMSPAEKNFGSVALGGKSEPQTFTITNEGTVASDKPTIATVGSEFTIAENGCAAALEGAASCTVKVVFTPDSTGLRSGTLSASLGAGSTPAMAALSGTGQAMPKLVASPSSFEFLPTVVGQAAQELTVTLMNLSATPLTGLTPASTSSDFTVPTQNCANGTIPANGSCTITVKFMPHAAGPVKGDLNLMVTGGIGTQVALSGSGLRPATLVLAPQSLNFPPTSVGSTSGGVTFTLRNDGQQDASTVSATITGTNKDEFAVVNNCGPTVRPDVPCSLVVTYTPKAVGVASAALAVTGTPGGTVTSNLTGNGVPPAAITLTPNVQDFGTVAVNASSGAFNFKVKNTGASGSGKLTVTAVGTEFRLPADANGCKDISLAANAECTISVIFSPTSAGSKTSTLTVVSEAAGTTGASFTGTGVSPPQLAIGPAMANFGSVGTGGTSSDLTFTVSNVGGSATGVVSVAPNSTQFQLSSNGCLNKALDVNESCVVGVRFAPSAVGDFAAKLVATASPGGTASADLAAAGTTPPSLVFMSGMTVKTVQDFGTPNVGETTAPIIVVLHNVSTAPTGMLATALAGNNPGDFAVVAGSNSCGAPLPASGTCQMSLTFKPSVAGARSAVLNVTSASGGVGSLLLTGTGNALLQFKQGMNFVTSHDFGEQSAGLESGPVTFTLVPQSATGTYTIAFDGGGSPPSFAITGSTCDGSPLVPGTGAATCTVDIKFQPQFPLGAKAGNLVVTTSAGVTGTLALTGTAIGALQLTPSPHNFGTVAAGTTQEQVFTLRNNGALPMTSVAVALVGADFSVTNDTCASPPLNAGSMCAITVRFVPTTPGAKTATLTATGSFTVAGATQTDVATVAISGNASGAAAISVTPASETFGDVAVGGTPVTKTFTVTNAAGAPTTGGVVRSISAGDYTLTRNGCVLANNTTPRPLAGGESCTFDVRFTPSTTGVRSGTLTVAANPGGTVNVPLTGTGLTALVLGVTTLDLDRSNTDGPVQNVLAQVNPKRRIVVTNRSNAAATALTPSFAVSSLVGATGDGPTYFNVTPDSTTGATPCTPNLAAGASCSFEIQMVTPGGASAGAKKAVFQVTSALPSSTTSAEVSGTMLRDAVIEFLDLANRDFGGVVVASNPATRHVIQLKNTGGVQTGALQALPLTNGFAQLPASGTNPTTGNSVCVLGQPLAVNQTCDILLQFNPTAVGAVTSTLKVYVTGPGEASAGIGNTNNIRTLAGTGLAPASLFLAPSPVEFGSASAGTASAVDRAVTLTNASGAPVTIGLGDITLSGGTAGYSIIGGSDCIGVIAGGVQCTVTVRFQPGLGATQGPALAALNVKTAQASLFANVTRAPALEIVAPTEGADWGEALVGTASAKRVFTVRNKGDGPTLTLPTVTVGGANASEFAVIAGDNTCTAVLVPGASCTVAVTLTPAAVGARAATIDATAGGTTAATTTVLAANGVLPNAIQIVSIGGTVGSATTVAFGNKAVGSETPIDVVIMNATSAQRVVSPSFTLGDTANFRYDTNPMGVATSCSNEIADGGGLEGGESCTVRIYFRPQALPAATVAAPNLTTTLVVGGAVTTLTLNLQGNAVSALSVTPTPGAFPNTAVNATSAPIAFTVHNSNDSNIGTTGQLVIGRSGTDAGSFRVVADTCTGNTLAPNADCSLSVVFEPTASGAKTATLTITAPSTNGATVPLTGTAQ